MSKLYQVDVDRVPTDAVELAKALRVVAKMSLADADAVQAHLAGSGGGTVVAGIALEVAEHIAKELGAAGAMVTVAESSVRSPCRADPAADSKFAWGRLRQLGPA